MIYFIGGIGKIYFLSGLRASWEASIEMMQQLILDFHCNHLLKRNSFAHVISHVQWSLEGILWLCHSVQVCASVTVCKFTP